MAPSRHRTTPRPAAVTEHLKAQWIRRAAKIAKCRQALLIDPDTNDNRRKTPPIATVEHRKWDTDEHRLTRIFLRLASTLREGKRLRGGVMGISKDFVFDFRRISRNQAVNQEKAERELSVQIRFRIQNHVVKATDLANTKLYSDRVPTAHPQKDPSALRLSVLIRVPLLCNCDGYSAPLR